MNNMLDSIWSIIETGLNRTVGFVDAALSPLEVLGPGGVICILAFLVVLGTGLFKRVYVTKRYLELKENFEHWHEVRKEAMKHPDPEKAKRLAKNIDQAELNRAYYDYFFEGFLKNLATNVLPIILTVGYVTTVYTPQTLMKRFGSQWVFSFSFGGSSQLNISSLFWFVICLLFWFPALAVIKHLVKKRYAKNKTS